MHPVFQKLLVGAVVAASSRPPLTLGRKGTCTVVFMNPFSQKQAGCGRKQLRLGQNSYSNQ